MATAGNNEPSRSNSGFWKRHKKKLIWAAALLIVAWTVFVAWASFSSTFDAARVLAFFTGMLALATFIASIAIAGAFAQVREAKRALKDNRTWNRSTFALTAQPPLGILFRWEEELEATFVKLLSRNEPLSDGEVKRLFLPEHFRVHLLLKSYMNAMESYCIAVNTGLASEEVGKRIWGYKLVRHFIELRPYIMALRAKAHSTGIYREMEALHDKWAPTYPHQGLIYGDGDEGDDET